jgi:hypothetical protein
LGFDYFFRNGNWDFHWTRAHDCVIDAAVTFFDSLFGEIITNLEIIVIDFVDIGIFFCQIKMSIPLFSEDSFSNSPLKK